MAILSSPPLWIFPCCDLCFCHSAAHPPAFSGQPKGIEGPGARKSKTSNNSTKDGERSEEKGVRTRICCPLFGYSLAVTCVFVRAVAHPPAFSGQPKGKEGAGSSKSKTRNNSAKDGERSKEKGVRALSLCPRFAFSLALPCVFC